MQKPVPHPLLAARRSDGRILKIAFLFALAAHVAVLLMPFKKRPLIPEMPSKPEITPTIPIHFKPPEIIRHTVAEVETVERRIPLPADDPDETMLEPVDEIQVPDLPPVFEGGEEALLLVDPEPPAQGIHPSWERNLVLPVRLEGGPEPDYPPLGMLSRTGGTVILQAVVDESGRVVELEVLRAPRPDPGFSQAALEAVSAWRYRPGTLNDRPVAVRMTVVVEFSLQ